MEAIAIKIPHWGIEEETGYKPITTFWQDFSIADKYGVHEIVDTFNRTFDEWKSDYKYLTELVLVLNHKTWQHYVPGGDKTQNRIASLYNALWVKVSEYALDNLRGSELDYYLKVTD